MNLPGMYTLILFALCLWREARGETLAGKTGVAWTIKNRADHPSWWGKSLVGVILCPLQFSSFNRNDPNATRFPTENDPAFLDCLQIAEGFLNAPGQDPTNGGTHYFDVSLDHNPPAWANTLTFRATIGRLHFYGPPIKETL